MVNLIADKDTFSIDVEFENSKQYYHDLKYQSEFKHNIEIQFFLTGVLKIKVYSFQRVLCDTLRTIVLLCYYTTDCVQSKYKYIVQFN